MESYVVVQLVAVVTGQSQQVFKTCGFRPGVLEEMDLVHVHVIDAITF